MKKQRGTISEPVFSAITSCAIALCGGATGGIAAYVGIKQDIAVIKTEVQYMRDDVQELQRDVKDLMRRGSPHP